MRSSILLTAVLCTKISLCGAPLANSKTLENTDIEYSVYAVNTDYTAEEPSRYAAASLDIAYAYEAKEALGFEFAVMSQVKLYEKETGNYDGNSPKILIYKANAFYQTDTWSLIIGRQEMVHEWLSDYHEAVKTIIEPREEFTVLLGYTYKTAAASGDEALENFTTFGQSGKGAALMDLAYVLDEKTDINLYALYAPDTFRAIGGSLHTVLGDMQIKIKHAQSFESSVNEETKGINGRVSAMDLLYEIAQVNFQGGYIQSGKKGGAGSLTLLGEQSNPLDFGEQVYVKDARTLYAGVSYPWSALDLDTEVIYAQTSYAHRKKENELNIACEIEIYDNAVLSFLYVQVNADDKEEDVRQFSAELTYTF